MNAPRLRLFPQDRALLESMQSPERLRRDTGLQFPGNHLETMRGLVATSVEYFEGLKAPPPWTGYLSIDEASDIVAGCAGFKGNPGEDKTVEIAYYTFPEYEGLGYGTALAGELVAIARAHPDLVRTVIAHTLPERNASCRILEKNGFNYAGLGEDPDEGEVWRWELALG